ncbi:MAG: ATP-binding protein, partial [Bacteroidota bacterium]
KWFRIKNAKVLENGVVVGITQDITLSKELESVKNERKLLLAGEKAAKTGSFIMNVTTKEVTYSQGLIHVLDLPEKGIHSQNIFEKFLERVYPGDVYKVMDGIEMGLKSKKWVEKEYRVLDRHGDTRYILSRCMGYQMPHVIVGIFTDITAEKGIRERISNIQQKLNRQRKLMLQGEELAKMATYTQYLDTGDFEVSPAFLDIFEIPIDKRKNPELLEYYYTLIHPEDLSILKDYSQKKYHLYKENNVTSIEYRLILPGNRVRWVLSRNIAGETPNVVMGTMQDITELKNFHLKLEETQRELEQFIYLVSHDLRAPIRHILSYSQWLELKQSDRLAEQGKEILGYVITAAERMGKMVDKLLDYSKTRNLIPHLQTVNLQKTIQEVCRKQEEQANLIPINWEIDPLPSIYADKEMTEQVFENLISNAIKFSSTKEEIHIKLSVETTDEKHTFTISDNGVGFPPEYKHKLFKIFQRLHDDDYPGSGIGLASVQRIIQLHGGEIYADGEPDKGATFTFTIPIH